MNNKAWLCLGLLSAIQAHAMNIQETLHARDQAMQALQLFNPKTALPNYTDNPKESTLVPHEEQDNLKQTALSTLREDKNSESIFHQAQNRSRLHNNPKAPAMQDAEALIMQADKSLQGECITLPHSQNPQPITHHCEETVQTQAQTCGEMLDVQIKTQMNTQQRIVINHGLSMPVTFNLSVCNLSLSCHVWQLWQPNPHCQALEVTVKQAGLSLPILKAPTCQDPNLTVQLNRTNYPRAIQIVELVITLKERLIEEHWLPSNCPEFEAKLTQNTCYQDIMNDCMHPNETRVIAGIPISRPCWGRETVYQCAIGVDSQCTPWIEQGCTHIASICIEQQGSFCRHFEQTYVCQNNHNQTTKTLCLKKPVCSQGECDTSQPEASQDAQEGLSRLAVFLQSAQGVAELGVQREWESSLFAGEPQSCQNYILGIRDCCQDRGWGDWVIHCPKPLQALLRAKHEGRVFYLGAYKHDVLSKTHVYCVFPSKLAGILQIQGRHQQLGHRFGEPKAPDCRGLSIQELQRIDFAKLDLSSLMSELQMHLHDLQTQLTQAQQKVPPLPPSQIGGQHE